MTQEQKPLNIYQKLVKVRQNVVYIQKNAKGHNYKYAAGSAIIAELRKEMDAQNLLLIPNMENFEMIQGVKLGSKVTISYTWVDADNPDSQIMTKFTYFDDKMGGCQGIGAILTYAERYFLCKFFQIATDTDDPDSFKKKHYLEDKEEEEELPKQPITEEDNTHHIMTLPEAYNVLCNHLPIEEHQKSYLIGYIKHCSSKIPLPLDKTVERCIQNGERFMELYTKWIDKNHA